LPITGDPFWLQMLVAQIVALHGAAGAPPVVRLERHAGGSALAFFWPGFCADGTGQLRLALIQGIARLQGAAVVPNANGLALHCPVDRRAPAAAAPAPGSVQ
jgi:hypothetical protein